MVRLARLPNIKFRRCSENVDSWPKRKQNPKTGILVLLRTHLLVSPSLVSRKCSCSWCQLQFSDANIPSRRPGGKCSRKRLRSIPEEGFYELIRREPIYSSRYIYWLVTKQPASFGGGWLLSNLVSFGGNVRIVNRKALAKRMQHVGATSCTIVERNVACVWPPCCTMLRSFGQPCSTCCNMIQQCCTQLHPFGNGLILPLPSSKVHSPWNISNRNSTSEVVRIDSIIIFYLSKLWKAKLKFLARLQEKFEIGHSWE